MNSFQTAAGTSDRLLSLQVLRAIAAIFVTIAHVSEEAKYFFGFNPFFDTVPLGKGVDLFFVLSGFIIYYASKAGSLTERQAPSKFILNRFVRVAPLYYIFTTLMILVVVFLPTGVKEARFDVHQIISSYLFWPYARELDGRVAPILSLGWTLNYEIFFYMIFSICLMLKVKNTAFIASTTIVALALIGAFIPETAPTVIKEWTDNIIIEFSFGIAIAYAYEKHGQLKQASIHMALLFALLGFVLLYFLNLDSKPYDLPRFIAAGVPAAIIVSSFVLLLPSKYENNLPKWLVALGDSSYSLYVSHRFILRPIQMVFNNTAIGKTAYAGNIYFIIAVVASCAIGHLVYLLIEKPIHKNLRLWLINSNK